MPAIDPRDLVSALQRAIEDSGCAALLLSDVREHPRRFRVIGPNDKTRTIWAFIWTLTPGGRSSLPNEYRIQMTGVSSPLPENPDGPTLLLGYYPVSNLFAGFDLAQHAQFTPGSPSVQIDIRKVRAARDTGLSFARKANDEIAVGIRPDHLMNYALHAPDLHKYGPSASVHKVLEQAVTQQPINDDELAALGKTRKRIVQTVSSLARSANFRRQVLEAYDYQCAITRRKLRLVDAAHILPVGAPDSIDDVRNGIALAPTYHRAFDQGLIFLNEHLRMQLNEQRLNRLREEKLTAGLDSFAAALGQVHLPENPRLRPNVSFISKANQYRGI